MSWIAKFGLGEENQRRKVEESFYLTDDGFNTFYNGFDNFRKVIIHD
jgi:hypothetical protein